MNTITDDQIAEIERKAEIRKGEGFYLVHNLPLAGLLALITRLREAERDAARMEWIEDNYYGDGGGTFFNMRLRFESDFEDCGSIRGLIDAAMQEVKQ